MVSEYAPGILWDWHWGWTLYSIGWQNAIFVENWNWVFEFTPAFIGAGMLTGINASYSFFGGAILAWGIIAPALVTTGKAFGEMVSPQYPGYMNYMNLVLDDPVNAPSPRYWLIWPGTMLLLCGSFAEVAANYRTLFAYAQQFTAPLIRRVRHTDINIHQEDLIEDPAPPEEQVPLWMWSGGVVVAIFISCLVLGVQYEQNVGLTLLAIVLAFVFSFIGAESAGRTNIIPVTTIGNASQLVIGGATKAHYPVKDSQLLNTTGGLLALGASEQSADMLGDLKTTHLLRASPRVQFYAQCCGAVVSIFMSVGIYVLFSTAYPCINDLSLQDNCQFAVPDVGAWRAISIAVSSPSLPIPPSSGYTSIGLGVLAILLTIIKYRFVKPENWHWIPNPNAVGIAFILNTTTYPAAMATGATIVYLWRKKHPASCAMCKYRHHILTL